MLRRQRHSSKKTSNYKPSISRIKMGSRRFTMLYEKAPDGGYTGSCLELYGTRTEGENKEELTRNMIEAINLTLEYLNSVSRDKQKIIINLSNN